jgi:molybdate transport system substrate-binding protein
MKVSWVYVATRAVLASVLMFCAGIAIGADLTFFSAVGIQEVTKELVPKFERATGHKVIVTYATLGAVLKRIESGETADVIVIPAQGIAGFVKLGKASESDVSAIAKSSVGVAVRRGTPKPDISSPEAFKQSMLEAKSILFSDFGGVGTPHVRKVFEGLGIAEEMRRKTIYAKVPGAAGIAQALNETNAQVSLNQLQEFATVAGMEIVGPLPGDLGLSTLFSAAVMGSAKDVQAARALVDFLRTPEAAAIIRSKGLEPAF